MIYIVEHSHSGGAVQDAYIISTNLTEKELKSKEIELVTRLGINFIPKIENINIYPESITPIDKL
jgi:hypothetical protein